MIIVIVIPVAIKRQWKYARSLKACPEIFVRFIPCYETASISLTNGITESFLPNSRT